MIQFKFTIYPCCKHANPIPFRRKIRMGFKSEEKCSYCQCRLKENNIVGTIMNVFVSTLLPFGFIAGVEIFKPFVLGSELGLGLEYFIIGGLLGLIISGFLAPLLMSLFVPLVIVEDGKNVK